MEAVSRRRGDSSPGIMAVGGFFVHFGVIPGATRSVSRSTGETSSTAPLSGHRRLYVAAVRQSTRGRRDGGPGRLEQLGRSRAGPADRTGRRLCGAQRPDGGEQTGRQPLRHRRDACEGAPRLSGWQAAMGASCFASGAALDRRRVGSATWPRRDVLQAPLRFIGDRCGSLGSIALSLLLLKMLS